MFDVSKYTKSKFVKGSDLPKRPATVTISKVYEHTFEQSGETKPALDFSDFDQSMALNRTQIASLIDALGPDVRLWIGQCISLQPVPSQFPGKPTIMITVADDAPAHRQPVGTQRQAVQRQAVAASEPPTWATEPPEEDDMPF